MTVLRTEASSTSEARGLPERALRRLRPVLVRRLSARWDVHVTGADQLPATGPVILISNHIGWLDGPLTVATATRPVHALVKQEAFEGRSGLLMRLGAQIPLHRGRTHTQAVRTALRVLRAGQVLLVYPEGTRGDGEVRSTYPGAAYFAMVTGAPIVPVAVLGTREPGADIESRPADGQRVDVVYGGTLHVEPRPWPRDLEALAAEQDRVAAALREHVAAAKELLGRELPGPPPRQEHLDD